MIKKGFTVVEILINVAIISFIIVVLANFYFTSNMSWMSIIDSVILDMKGRIAVSNLTSDITYANKSFIGIVDDTEPSDGTFDEITTIQHPITDDGKRMKLDLNGDVVYGADNDGSGGVEGASFDYLVVNNVLLRRFKNPGYPDEDKVIATNVSEFSVEQDSTLPDIYNISLTLTVRVSLREITKTFRAAIPIKN